MSLQAYKEKRNFNNTPEPGPEEARRKGKLRFVVQRHDASHLHYDFRLEMEGVLKSWAVPKGPSMHPGDKRLAVEVEDHPFEYRKFAGSIPEGNYGAGEVDIWDEGTYTPLAEVKEKEEEALLLQELQDGSLKFVLNGTHLQGEFALVKMKGRGDKNWLLLKHKDKFAQDEEYDIEQVKPVKMSAHSTFGKVATTKGKAAARGTRSKAAKPTAEEKSEKAADPEPAEKAAKSALPEMLQPMLAVLGDEPFDDDNFIFEIKWDGYRAIALLDGESADLVSRNGLLFNGKYPSVIKALADLKISAVLDGEVVALDHEGRSRFQYLQNQSTSHEGTLCFAAFDLLLLNGEDLRSLPLTERKSRLEALLQKNKSNHIRYSDHVTGHGIDFFDTARAAGLEGIMAKLALSPYESGARSRNWIKLKTELRQEAVIAGYTEPRNSRKHLGALILGLYDGDTLNYIGHCGGGFNTKSLEMVHDKLQPLERKTCPLAKEPNVNAPVTWVKPELVCEVSFAEWTKDGIMRQPIFHGLREDKPAKAVKRELTDTKAAHQKSDNTEAGESPEPAKTMSIHQTKARHETHETDDIIGGVVDAPENPISLITHPDKVFWPEEGYTKLDLAEYYLSVAPYILPYLKNRPMSLHRHPNGIKGSSFFQKNMEGKLPEWLQTVKIHSDSAERDVRYLLCPDAASLLYMVNLGCIELHPWNSSLGHTDNPDYIVIDLDPDDGNTFAQVVETALVVKEVLDKAGIKCYPKTSGATGIHIFIPLAARYDFEQAGALAELIANMVHEQLPDTTSVTRSKKERKGLIYVDFLQNRSGQTLASAYSVRPVPGACVSTPLDWKELKPDLLPTDFTIKNIPARLKKKGDLFKAVLGEGNDIAKALEKLGS
ncbi:MAG: DNA ligase D [Bacteroidota bacterium]